MAVNDSRSMNSDFHQGTVDSSYISLTPDRGNPQHPPLERLLWPRYENAERLQDSAFFEANVQHYAKPVERKTSAGGDDRY